MHSKLFLVNFLYVLLVHYSSAQRLSKLCYLFYFFECKKFHIFFSTPKDEFQADKSRVTTSGVSSGGSVASQFHIAYSSKISGVGIIGGRKLIEDSHNII